MKNYIQNIEIIFGTSLRVPILERDPKMFYYDVRHDDECQGIPCELNKRVVVNHLGTIATNKELQIELDGYLLSDEEQLIIENALYGGV